MSCRRPQEMALAYETLRAAATSKSYMGDPVGKALVLAAGLPGWLWAWEPLQPVIAAPASSLSSRHDIPLGLGGDVVQLLTEMALACTTRVPAL